MNPHLVRIGWDPAQRTAFDVAALSLLRSSPTSCSRSLSLSVLRPQGLYTRQIERRDHGYWDPISEAPMSTEHAISRFLIPVEANFQGWCLFTDGDVLFRKDVAQLFALADPTKAVMVVQHQHAPSETVKMQGQIQTAYHRKNWSSVMLWNCAHPANRALTVKLVNTLPGRDLHRFCWLADDEVGALPPEWNVLIGEEDHPDPAIAHFTRGVPDMAGYEHQPFADEWYKTAELAGHNLRRPLQATA